MALRITQTANLNGGAAGQTWAVPEVKAEKMGCREVMKSVLEPDIFWQASHTMANAMTQSLYRPVGAESVYFLRIGIKMSQIVGSS